MAKLTAAVVKLILTTAKLTAAVVKLIHSAAKLTAAMANFTLTIAKPAAAVANFTLTMGEPAAAMANPILSMANFTAARAKVNVAAPQTASRASKHSFTARQPILSYSIFNEHRHSPPQLHFLSGEFKWCFNIFGIFFKIILPRSSRSTRRRIFRHGWTQIYTD
jgi:hypothetical protein